MSRTDELIDFVKSCALYHPDETPEWFLEELKHDGDDMDDAYDSFRVRYGSDADMDTIRAVCEEARRLLKDLGESKC
ncbi:MAG: hypothetical protein CMM27_10490 [Rhodospirillaceae bacterium]|nr:hypothetical protein [Rhodospirillaceae bacterium]